MTNTEIIQAIRNEIERLYDGEAPAHAQQCEFEDGYFAGIGAISKFLDTLESEKPVPKDLEEAVDNIYKIPFGTRAEDFIAGAEWQKGKSIREMIMSDGSYFQKCYKLGKKDMNEQMLKEAVVGVAHPDDCEVWINLVGYGYKFNEGDKVRIIIVKEED